MNYLLLNTIQENKDRLAFIELPEDKFLVQFNKLNSIFKFKPINLSYLDIYLEEYLE
jgi:hypothetical protein